MANKVDGSRAGYLIPGVELDPAAAVNREGIGSGFSDALQNKTYLYAETPAMGGLQELFSLHRIVPEPSHIGPPPKPLSLEGAPGGGSAAETYLPLLRNAFAPHTGSGPPSVEVQRMMDLLTGHKQASHAIRARSGQGSGR